MDDGLHVERVSQGFPPTLLSMPTSLSLGKYHRQTSQQLPVPPFFHLGSPAITLLFFDHTNSPTLQHLTPVVIPAGLPVKGHPYAVHAHSLNYVPHAFPQDAACKPCLTWVKLHSYSASKHLLSNKDLVQERLNLLALSLKSPLSSASPMLNCYTCLFPL